MNNNGKQLILLLILLFTACNVKAQMPGPSSVGLRGTPDGGGISAKIFVGGKVCIDGQVNGSVGFPNISGQSVTGGAILEYYAFSKSIPWALYFGPGVQFGVWRRYNEGNLIPKPCLGLTGIFGIEYSFRNIPVGAFIDIKPSFMLNGGPVGFPNNTFGFGLRYYFDHWYDSNGI